MREITIKIEGMVCTGCENRVQNAIKTIEGVESVIADYTNGTVIIHANERVTESIIKEKIEDIGFQMLQFTAI